MNASDFAMAVAQTTMNIVEERGGEPGFGTDLVKVGIMHEGHYLGIDKVDFVTFRDSGEANTVLVLHTGKY